jgi:hypothetical protein
MNRREAAAIVLLFIILLALAAFWPVPHAVGDTPIIAIAIPASEFVEVQPVAGTPRPFEDPAPSPSASSVPASTPVRSPAPQASTSVTGTASWYRYVVGGAAAGPRLRAALGPDWRGSVVTVCAAICVRVRLSDWMAADHLVDLDSRSFSRLAPLSRGVVEVSVRW